MSILSNKIAWLRNQLAGESVDYSVLPIAQCADKYYERLAGDNILTVREGQTVLTFDFGGQVLEEGQTSQLIYSIKAQ